MIPSKDDGKDNLIKMLQDTAAKLSEHFENVQIFCSGVEEGGDNTVSFNKGSGNIYAREGQVRDWLVKQEERVRQDVRKEDADNT